MSELVQTIKKFDSPKSYFEHFKENIKYEMENEERLKDFKCENLSGYWEKINKTRHLYLYVETKNFIDRASPSVGTDVIVECREGSREYKFEGLIAEVNVNFIEKIRIKICLYTKKYLYVSDDLFPQDLNIIYSMRMLMNRELYARMYKALNDLATLNYNRISKEVVHAVILNEQYLDCNILYNYECANQCEQLLKCPTINKYQNRSLMHSLVSTFSLIQGPPGTGKSTTIVAVVCKLLPFLLACYDTKQCKILLCAPSNQTADDLAEKLFATGVNVLRLYSKGRELYETKLNYMSVHGRLFEILNRDPETGRLVDQFVKLALGPEDQRRFHGMKNSITKKLLAKCNVVCCTTICAGDDRLQGFFFPYVVIDEATKDIEPASLVPLSMGCQKAVLVGDPKQLGPIVQSPDAVRNGLGVSLFERLCRGGFACDMLEIQYRMHPELAAFSSLQFYGGRLKNGVDAADRTPVAIDWPNPSVPMIFHDSKTPEEKSMGNSYMNRGEAAVVLEYVRKLTAGGVKLRDIGIITFYQGQRSYLTGYFIENGVIDSESAELKIASVDSFQGCEMDYIILSTVRSSLFKGVGFLADPTRFNVAITRAKYAIIIIGNKETLVRDELWSQYIKHLQQRGVVV